MAPRTTLPLPGAARSSRAVLRPIEPGSDSACAHCAQAVKFASKSNARQVIANVYTGGRWQRVEHFHANCYDLAGAPYGPAPG